MPHSVRRAIGRGIVGCEWRAIHIEQPESLEPESLENFVVPEEIAAWAAGLADNSLREADGFGRFGVETGLDDDACFLGKIVKNLFRKFAIEGRVNYDLRAG